jgi:hypothetical protein
MCLGKYFTGYCCWFMRDLGQHTLLAIVVGLWRTSDKTLYWVLLWVMRGFGQHTLLGIIRSDVGHLHQWVQNNPFFILVLVEKSKCRFPYILRNGWSEYPLTNKITWHCFPVSQPLQTWQTCHNPTNLISYSQTCTFPPSRPEDGYMLVILNSSKVHPTHTAEIENVL